MNMKKKFSFESIDGFDNHIALSIPNYEGLCDIFRAIAVENTNPEGLFIDCGCSTGKFLSELPRLESARYAGFDLVDIRKHYDFDFYEADNVDALKNVESADVVVVMFTLQFMGKHARHEMISELKRLNDNGAVILIAEKVLINDVGVNQILHREHLKTKRQSFSDSEILDKDYDLMGSMFCLTDSQINKELSVFRNVSQVWQNYNFKAWCIT